MEAETEVGIQPKQEPIEDEDKPNVVTNLYSGHKIKEEIVIGPEILQKSDATYIEISLIKIEPEVLDGDDTLIEEGSFGQLDTTSVGADHSEVQHAYKLNVTVDGVKVEEEHPVEVQPDGDENGNEGPVGTVLHMQKEHLDLAREDTTTLDVPSCHKGAHSSGDQFHCDSCLKPFFSEKEYLKNHSIIPVTQKPSSCEICNKKFIRKSDLKRHLVVHSKEKPFSCDICLRQFSQCSSLKRHLVVHKKEKPFSCDICNKTFKSKSCLKTHLMIHTGVTRFSCDICNNKFNHIGHLKRHLMVHTKEKPFSCDICNKQFREKYRLRLHLMVHTNNKSYSCDICYKEFSQERVLKRHLLIHTKNKHFPRNISTEDGAIVITP